MKKLLFSVMFLCSSSIGFAQLLEVASTEKVNLPEGTAAAEATISPAGDYLLLSDFKKQGLQTYNLATGELTTVTTASPVEPEKPVSAYLEFSSNELYSTKNSLVELTKSKSIFSSEIN